MIPRPTGRRFSERVTLPRAIGVVVLITTAFTLLSALVMRAVEPETFNGYGRAWWWAVQTVSTVGYGDITPQTLSGRLVATVVMIFGVALVPTVTTIVVSILLDKRTPDSQPK